MKLFTPKSLSPAETNETCLGTSVPSLTHGNNERINILLVDDEQKNLTVLETVLNDPGYRLVRADSADQALLALVKEEFALMVLDIQMPGMTGFELAQMVKQRKKTAGIPIIFLTAYYSEDEHVLEGYGTGAVDYLHKPVNPAILRSKVAVFAALYRTTRQVELANTGLLAEIAERRRVEEQLLQLNNDLEKRVEERTSELTRAYSELKDAHQRKDEFLATLAHELRNPLAPIRNAIEIMRLAGNDHATTSQVREIMERQVRQMVRLVDDLLDLSRISSGKIDLQLELLEIHKVIESAVETSKPHIEGAHHRLIQEWTSQKKLSIRGDAVRLTQIISNLLNNAAKYTPEGGMIWLTVEQDALDVVIRVKDNGVGIPPAMLPRIFDIFTQVDRSLKRAQGGLGIGLSLVRKLVAMHCGSVVGFSEGEGKGCEFVVRLPLDQETSN